MPEHKNLGHDVAMVNLKGGGTALVKRGEDIPGNLADGELDRLRGLGVLTEPEPVASYGERMRASQPVTAETQIQLDKLKADLDQALAAQAAEAERAAAAEAKNAELEAKLAETETPKSEEPAGNASTDEWREYATGLGIDVPEGAGREDIKALVAAKQQ